MVSIILVIQKPLMKDKKKQGENHESPGDREKASKTWSLPAKPGELIGLLFPLILNFARINMERDHANAPSSPRKISVLSSKQCNVN